MVVTRSTALLLRMLTMHSPAFVITNKSMAVLVQRLSSDLLRAVRTGKERELFEFWDRQVGLFSQTLIARGFDGMAKLPNGASVPLVTEELADRTFLDCPPGPEF